MNTLVLPKEVAQKTPSFHTQQVWKYMSALRVPGFTNREIIIIDNEFHEVVERYPVDEAFQAKVDDKEKFKDA